MATISLHVVPRARATAVAGKHGDAVRIRIAAPPVNGAANAELVRYLAARLGVATRQITIVAGAGGRRKTVAVEGMERERIERALLEDAG